MNVEGGVDEALPDVGPSQDRYLGVGLRSQGGTCTMTLHGALCPTSVAALEAQVDQLGCLACDERGQDAAVTE